MVEFNKLRKAKELLITNTFQNREILINHINTLNHNFNDLSEQVSKIFYNKRNKRGLINGLGSIIKSISRSLDDSDNERYMKLFDEIKNNQIILENNSLIFFYYIKNITSYFGTQLKKIDSNEKYLNDQIKHIKEILIKNAG